MEGVPSAQVQLSSSLSEARSTIENLQAQVKELQQAREEAPAESVASSQDSAHSVPKPTVKPRSKPKSSQYRSSASSRSTPTSARKRSRSPRRHQSTLSFAVRQPVPPAEPPPGFEYVDHPAFQPSASPLSDSCPSGHQLKCIQDWIAEVSKHLPRSSKEGLQCKIEEVDRIWHEMTTELRPDLVDLAAQWGLPKEIATKARPNGLLQIIAVATFLSA